ncbi:restriction endonuclease [Xanthomonas campestris]|uniref:restriction endonuclease n=1 Tax=Xanthomonas campestris TaxID=339 RepID=UPI002379626C|nr:restriction endonuclease [Xanthomonas campestris]WDJ88986.1 restriction endonuclease [Xanthomonas campestris]
MPLHFQKKVFPIHFLDLSGDEFERLVFASLFRMHAWHTLDWFGQTGGDDGKDIIGTRDDFYGEEETVVFACANWKNFTSTKGISDIDKIVAAMDKLPAEIIIAVGSNVSAETKEKCITHAKSKGVHAAQVWSGTEFEERLRFHADSVLRRFFEGEELPHESGAIRKLVVELNPSTETEAGALVARLFIRPAFMTPIWGESSLPAFRQAIGDTINALNTGIWRDREGTIISRICPGHLFPSDTVRTSLANAVKALIRLRLDFDTGLRNGLIRSLSAEPEGPFFEIEQGHSRKLEKTRQEALNFVNCALSELRVPLLEV